MFGRKKTEKQRIQFDPSEQAPAVRCSICTGEAVAGLRNRSTGHFEELMLIKNDADLAEFRSMLGLAADEEIAKFY